MTPLEFIAAGVANALTSRDKAIERETRLKVAAEIRARIPVASDIYSKYRNPYERDVALDVALRELRNAACIAEQGPDA